MNQNSCFLLRNHRSTGQHLLPELILCLSYHTKNYSTIKYILSHLMITVYIQDTVYAKIVNFKKKVGIAIKSKETSIPS